jgi:serine protease Do
MNRLRKYLIATTIGGASVATFLVGSNFIDNVKFAHAAEQVQVTRQQLSTVTDLSNVFKAVGKAIAPSVVNIQVRKTIKGGANRVLPFDDDMLRRFFPDRDGDGEPDLPPGMGGGGDLEQVGTGSGVIMEVGDGVGYILTNNHVAGGASEMDITLSDGREIKNGKLLGADPKSDLAVVKIEADKLIPAKWGDSSQLDRGDWVLAFGSPFGYVGSMTHGIVSALNRHAGILEQQQGYENFIQVDAPINPGNSGGPLVNLHGEVVGINTAIASRSGGFQGIGFAIPSNQAKYVYQSLKSSGHVTRGWLGVAITDVSQSDEVVQSLGYTGSDGVLVEQTFPNTPADGKLKHGDIITKMAGNDVHDTQKLRNPIAMTPRD